MNWSVRRIDSISALNNADRYLEIGVNKGETFLNVQARFKDGVDPDFQFDTMAFATPGIRFFTQTSDQFWISGEPGLYDIIFIDGMHTFEQTLRDFIASIRHSHRRTVWIIDDTLPSDVFSSLRDKEHSFRERRQHGLGGLPWHGDVYKVVLMFHDFFPGFSYRTIIGSGNPQTIVWQAPRKAFQPKLNSLEAISRLTYFDIQSNANLFNLTDEEASLRNLSSDLAGT